MSAPVKAYLRPEKGPDIHCLFNPAELSITKTNAWTASKGKGKNTPRMRFQEGQAGSLTVSLTIDTTADGSPVTKHTNALLALMKVDGALPGSDAQRNQARPPWVRFHWGDFHSFKAIVERLQIKFTYFASDGTPLRAKADLTLKQYEDEEAWGPQNPTSQTPLPHRLHHVSPGETLDRIAALHLGDPTRWRMVAEANGILDPFTVRPGTTLIIPEPTGVRRG